VSGWVSKRPQQAQKAFAVAEFCDIRPRIGSFQRRQHRFGIDRGDIREDRQTQFVKGMDIAQEAARREPALHDRFRFLASVEIAKPPRKRPQQARRR
jgi:hypothetical protein